MSIILASILLNTKGTGALVHLGLPLPLLQAGTYLVITLNSGERSGLCGWVVRLWTLRLLDPHVLDTKLVHKTKYSISQICGHQLNCQASPRLNTPGTHLRMYLPGTVSPPVVLIPSIYTRGD